MVYKGKRRQGRPYLHDHTRVNVDKDVHTYMIYKGKRRQGRPYLHGIQG